MISGYCLLLSKLAGTCSVTGRSAVPNWTGGGASELSPHAATARARARATTSRRTSAPYTRALPSGVNPIRPPTALRRVVATSIVLAALGAIGAVKAGLAGGAFMYDLEQVQSP